MRALAAISALVIFALWLERYLLVTPSIFAVEWVSGAYVFSHRENFIFSAREMVEIGRGIALTLGFLELVITLAFFATAALCYLLFLHRFPPQAD